MADAYSAALIQALQGQRQQYAAQNPLIAGGQALSGANTYDPQQGGWQNALVAGLTGFGGGLISGVGQNMANSDYQDLNTRLYDQLKSADPAAGMRADPELQQFAPIYELGQQDRAQQLNDARSQYQLQAVQDIRKAGILEDIKNPYREGAQERLAALGLTRSQPVEQPADGGMMPSEPAPAAPIASGVQPTEAYMRQAQGDSTIARTLMERDLQAPDRLRSGMNTLREDFQGQKEVQNFITADTGFRSLAGAMKDPYSTSDVEIVKSIVQAIEPGLAVNGGETEAIIRSGSFSESVKGQLIKTLKDGSALTDDVREGLFRIAKRRYIEHASKFKLARENALTRVKKLGGDPLELGYLSNYEPMDIGDPNSTVPETIDVGGKTHKRNPQDGKYYLVK